MNDVLTQLTSHGALFTLAAIAAAILFLVLLYRFAAFFVWLIFFAIAATLAWVLYDPANMNKLTQIWEQTRAAFETGKKVIENPTPQVVPPENQPKPKADQPTSF